MSKTQSFTDVDATNAAEIPAEGEQTPVASNLPATQNTTTAIAEYDEDFDCSNDGFSNDLDSTKIKVPRLQLAHGVGGLSKLGFVPGSLVFSEQVALVEPARGKTEITPAEGVLFYVLGGLGGGLDYLEVLPKAEQDAGKKPRAFRTEAQARAAGLYMGKEYRTRNNPADGKYTPRLSIKALVECPKGVPDALFPLDFKGRKFALAQITFTKGSYWKAGVDIYTHVNTSRQLNKARPGEFPLWYAAWRLFTKNDPIPGKNDSAWTLYSRQEAVADAEFKAWAAQYA